MLIHQIIFPAVNEAALVEKELPAPSPTQVLVKTVFSTVSPGTERANITGSDSVAGANAPKVKFPRALGYSAAGEVIAVGEKVESVAPGDRVAVMWGKHASYSLSEEKNIVRLPEGVSYADGAALLIGTFPLAAIRKTRLEIGEACMVMGLGLLGQFAVRLAKAAGAVPVIACDPVESRRADALAGGADFALDPTQEGFAEQVKTLTGKGVSAAIEVTGVGAGLNETLDCMARFGRIALLGCTRDPNFTVDYYRKIHFPGVTLIGAHSHARPEWESSPGWFTHRDDMQTLMKLITLGRLDISAMHGPVYAPQDCKTVYDALIHDRNFPMMVQFDWRKL